jgi:hypothetical protein
MGKNGRVVTTLHEGNTRLLHLLGHLSILVSCNFGNIVMLSVSATRIGGLLHQFAMNPSFFRYFMDVFFHFLTEDTCDSPRCMVPT